MRIVTSRHNGDILSVEPGSHRRGLCKILTYLGIALSILLPVLPLTPLVNPSGVPISVDTYYYYRWLVTIERHGIAYAYVTDMGLRPIYLTLLYLIHLAGVPIWAVSMYHIVPLLILFTITTYFFTKAIFKNDLIAAFATFVCPLSISFITFLYGGFHANLFALSLLMICLILLFSARDVRSPRFVLSCIISILVLFIHPWVWVQLTAGLVIYAIILHLRKRGSSMRKLWTFILISTVCGAARLLYHLKALRSVAMPVIGVVTTGHVSQLPSFMWFQFNVFVWGSVSVLFFYLAGISALLYLTHVKERLNYLDTLLFVSLFPFLSQPLRVIINVFPHIFVGVFLFSLLHMFESRISRTLVALVLALLVVYGFYWALMSVPSYSSIPWNIPRTC
ncbi:MAG: hypothetical protein GXO23_06710 [Crenarchaeota archaeon]|nr:hypothetical protein [Thermoproteota archaeon]